MALSSIVTDTEAWRFLGRDINDIPQEHSDLMCGLRMLVERAIRSELQMGITQATYTHYMPREMPENYDRRLSLRFKTAPVQRIMVPECPIRSITSVHEDEDAYGGDGTDSPWSSSTELTVGSDYMVDWDQSGLSMSGFLIRLNSRGWCTTPGSIRVIYTAGWSDDEIDGDVTDYNLDASDIKLATMLTIKDMWDRSGVGVSASSGGSAGNVDGVKRERLADYEIEYMNSQSSSAYSAGNTFGVVSIPPHAKGLLQRFYRVSTLVL